MTPTARGRLRAQLEELADRMETEIRRIANDFQIYTVPSVTVAEWMKELRTLALKADGT